MADRYPLHWPADPRDWLTPPALLAAWVAVAEGDIAGHVALCAASGDDAAPVWCAASGLPAEQLAVVGRLFVAPWARGRALGASLLNAACAEASARGLRAALDVLAHNHAAMALYERAGWRRVASVPVSWAPDGALLHYYLAPD